MSIRSIIESEFKGPMNCYGHCQHESKMRFLPSGENLIVCFVCSAGYVSRIVVYGEELNLSGFKQFLSKLLPIGQVLEDGDIRVATRYRWNLGVQSDKERVMAAAYWTQNYRRTKSDNPERIAVFLCSRCNALFFQHLNEKNKLCEKCR